MTTIHRIVEALMLDLADRKGFELNTIHPDDLKEWRLSWCQIVAGSLQTALGLRLTSSMRQGQPTLYIDMGDLRRATVGICPEGLLVASIKGDFIIPGEKKVHRLPHKTYTIVDRNDFEV